MATDTTFTLYGFWYLAGGQALAQVGGLYCGGNFTVLLDGSIVVPFFADGQGLLSPEYLISIDGYVGESAGSITFIYNDTPTTVTVPIVVGIVETTQGQGLRPATAADIKSQEGDALGKIRRSERVSFLLSNTIGLEVGTDFNQLEALVLPGADGETPLPATTMFTGVARLVVTDSYSFDSMVCWQVSEAWPCTVCSFNASLHTSDL